MNRSAGQPAAPARATSNGAVSPPAGGKKGNHWNDSPMWLRVVWTVLLFSLTIILISSVALIYFGGAKEGRNIDQSKHQAVFLASGQVYFGELKAANSKFLDLRGIYYLNVNQQVQPNQSDDKQQNSSISLVKLGCELHGPVDQMIINRDQVTFWENLKDESQVSKAIAEWVKQNPNGQKCQTATNTTNNTGTNN